MPVTKTAKRALRGSQKKAQMNLRVNSLLEKSVRAAKKAKSVEKIKIAISQADRAAKKRTIHQNKAARIKKRLTSLLPKKSATTAPVKKAVKKTKK